MTLPFLAITLGDPAGLGPWVGAQALGDKRIFAHCRGFLVGDAEFLRARVRPSFRRLHVLSHLDDYIRRTDTLNIWHVPAPGLAHLKLGRAQRTGGLAAMAFLREAVALARSRKIAAVVTGPVSKESFKMAGSPYPGHTEMLAALSRVKHVEMLMTAGPLKALLLTRHLPLKDVSRHLEANELVRAVFATDQWLRRTSGRTRPPVWAFCGLNPHAGDRGLLGSEEKTVVTPAVRRLRKRGVHVDGPLPADVAWAEHAKGRYDAVACLYHDQGMIPLKMTAPRAVVNVTVGLPWVRTSPGHGTAYDLAGGRAPFAKADPSATVEAARTALRIAAETFKGES